MIREEPLSQQEIDQQLTAFVTTQKFNLSVGLFMTSVACLGIAFLTEITSKILDNRPLVIIWILGELILFAGIIILTVKFQKFRTVFKWGTLPLLIICGAVLHEKGLLITVLIFTLLMVFYSLFKYAAYYSFKDNLQGKKKKIMVGIVTYCAQEDRNVTVRAPKPYWVLTVSDGKEQLTFSLSNMDVLRLYWSGTSNTGFASLKNKEVKVSFVPLLNKVLSISLTNPLQN